MSCTLQERFCTIVSNFKIFASVSLGLNWLVNMEDFSDLVPFNCRSSRFRDPAELAGAGQRELCALPRLRTVSEGRAPRLWGEERRAADSAAERVRRVDGWILLLLHSLPHRAHQVQTAGHAGENKRWARQGRLHEGHVS